MYSMMLPCILFSIFISLAVRDYDNQTQIIIFNSSGPSSTICVNTTVFGDSIIEGEEVYLVRFLPLFPVNPASKLTTKVLIEDNDGKLTKYKCMIDIIITCPLTWVHFHNIKSLIVTQVWKLTLVSFKLHSEA